MEPIAELGKIEGPDQMGRARRSQMYRFLAECFRYPGKDFFDMAREGEHLKSALALMHEIPFEVPVEEGALSGRLLKDVSRDDFEAEFVRIFDAGPGGPPCPLYEGKYAADRMVNMEDLVRFYNNFGLSVAEAPERELPDHITTELEFMHYLAFKEVLALQRDEPGERNVYEEGGDQQEDRRNHLGHGFELIQLRIDKGMGLLIFAAIRPRAAIALQYVIKLLDDLRFLSIAQQFEGNRIKRAIKIEHGGERFFRHPHDGEAVIVRDQIAGPERINEFR